MEKTLLVVIKNLLHVLHNAYFFLKDLLFLTKHETQCIKKQISGEKSRDIDEYLVFQFAKLQHQ
jgi:hypothetical protein